MHNNLPATKADFKHLDSKIDASVARLDTKIDTAVDRLDRKLDFFIDHMDSRFDAVGEVLATIVDNMATKSELEEVRTTHTADHRTTTLAIRQTNRHVHGLQKQTDAIDQRLESA